MWGTQPLQVRQSPLPLSLRVAVHELNFSPILSRILTWRRRRITIYNYRVTSHHGRMRPRLNSFDYSCNTAVNRSPQSLLDYRYYLAFLDFLFLFDYRLRDSPESAWTMAIPPDSEAAFLQLPSVLLTPCVPRDESRL